MFGKIYGTIHEIKLILTLSKPIYIGATVLELSKWFMNGFHCSFDFSNYPEDSKIFDQANKKVIGKMKEE